jgi:hypothetical protein
MAGFQQFQESGATDRSGSAGQANRMRANAESQAGSMVASSIGIRGDVVANTLEKAFSIVQTGATQHAKQEYMSGETQLDVEGVSPEDIKNYSRIEAAHRSGKITADQANLAKRKLGVKVLKRHPLADPKDLSASLFNQADFKRNAADRQIERDIEFRDKLLQKSGFYRPDYTPEERAIAEEAAIRVHNQINRNKKVSEVKGAQAKAAVDAVRANFVTGTGASDFYSGVEATVLALKKALVVINNSGGSVTEKKQLIEQEVAKQRLSFQKRNASFNFFPEGSAAVTAGLASISKVADMYSDDILTGKLDAEKLYQANRGLESKLTYEFNKTYGTSSKILKLSSTIAQAISTNPGAFPELSKALTSLTKQGAAKIGNPNLSYQQTPQIPLEGGEAVSALFAVPLPDKVKNPEEYTVNANTRATVLKSIVKDVESGGTSSDIAEKAYTNIFSSMKSKQDFMNLPEGTAEAYKDFYFTAAANDYIPNLMKRLQTYAIRKGFSVEDIGKYVNLTVNQGKLLFVPKEDSERAVSLSETLNRSNETMKMSKYTLSASTIFGEAPVISLLNEKAAPSLYGVEPGFSEKVGNILGSAARIGVATGMAVYTEPQALMRKGIVDASKFLIDLGTTKDNRLSNLAKNLDSTEEEVIKAFSDFADSFGESFNGGK